MLVDGTLDVSSPSLEAKLRLINAVEADEAAEHERFWTTFIESRARWSGADAGEQGVAGPPRVKSATASRRRTRTNPPRDADAPPLRPVSTKFKELSVIRSQAYCVTFWERDDS